MKSQRESIQSLFSYLFSIQESFVLVLHHTGLGLSTLIYDQTSLVKEKLLKFGQKVDHCNKGLNKHVKIDPTIVFFRFKN